MITYYDQSGAARFATEPPLEPPDDANDPGQEPAPVCFCSKCKQGVWGGEYTYDGMCEDCFHEKLFDDFTLSEIAEHMGYEVLLH